MEKLKSGGKVGDIPEVISLRTMPVACQMSAVLSSFFLAQSHVQGKLMLCSTITTTAIKRTCNDLFKMVMLHWCDRIVYRKPLTQILIYSKQNIILTVLFWMFVGKKKQEEFSVSSFLSASFGNELCHSVWY